MRCVGKENTNHPTCFLWKLPFVEKRLSNPCTTSNLFYLLLFQHWWPPQAQSPLQFTDLPIPDRGPNSSKNVGNTRLWACVLQFNQPLLTSQESGHQFIFHIHNEPGHTAYPYTTTQSRSHHGSLSLLQFENRLRLNWSKTWSPLCLLTWNVNIIGHNQKRFALSC